MADVVELCKRSRQEACSYMYVKLMKNKMPGKKMLMIFVCSVLVEHLVEHLHWEYRK